MIATIMSEPGTIAVHMYMYRNPNQPERNGHKGVMRSDMGLEMRNLLFDWLTE
jgi:hypothetical protein